VPAVPTRFPELNELLESFVGSVKSILDDNFVGAYLTGSFALGGGDMSSDCDFIVVTESKVTHQQENALRQLHAEIPSRDGYWAINLEGSYAPRRDLESLDTLGREWLYIDRGWREMQWSPHCNVADTRWVLRHHGVVLEGPEPSTFACEVPAEALRDRVRPLIQDFLTDLGTWTGFETMWGQRYTVESLCRMLYTLERGEVTSKAAGLEWALSAVAPVWHDLLAHAVADRPAKWNDPPRPGSIEPTRAFAEYAKEYAAGR